MAKLTPFGIEIRKIRLDRNLLLLDLADALRIRPSFVSAVETGKKPIPDSYIPSVAKALELSPDEIMRLQRAADESRKQVSVEHMDSEGRQIVAAVSRMRPEQLAVLRRTLLKSTVNETPFRRTNGLLVPPRSQDSIMDIAERLRKILLPDDHVYFPIVEVLEYAMPQLIEGFHLDICDEIEMGNDEGRVCAGGDYLALREDVYEGAVRGKPRDRFTASHELGHFMMHREIVFARTRGDDDKIYCDSEWQADVFAGSLLMSSGHISKFSCISDAAKQCGMSEQAARIMWNKLQPKGGTMQLI